MLRMSKMADYGTVVMTCMAREPGKVYSAMAVAAQIGMAPPTVSKILKILARKDLLVSQRGAKGGYILARAPEEISIAQIINAMEGPIGLTECSVTAGLCAQETACNLRANWQRLNHVIRRALEDMSLAEMAQPPQHYPVEFSDTRLRSGRAHS